MKALIDTLFNPILTWLQTIQDNLSQASIPVSRPLELNQFFAPITILGAEWTLFVTNVLSLAFIYMIIYITMNSVGLIETLRNAVKWW